MPRTTHTIAVTGDVTIDWLLLSSADEQGAAVDSIWMWGGAYPCHVLSSSGGAASHAHILRATAARAGRRDIAIVGPEVPREALASPLHPAYSHTFARIKTFPQESGTPNLSAWRIAAFLGTNPAREAPIQDEEPAPDEVDTLMIVDHAMGFRQQPIEPTRS
jgi:hypothetical protein